MPYRTKSGTHYHETYGCCGAKESCSTDGLIPCRICCGTSSGGGAGEAAGIPSAGSSQGGLSGLFITDAGAGHQAGNDHVQAHDRRETDVATLRYEATDDCVMRLAETLLAIKAGWDAAKDGQCAPNPDGMDIASENLRTVLDALPQPPSTSTTLGEHSISSDDIQGRMSPREAFEWQRNEEFLDDFRRKTTELIRKWDEDEWKEWRETREDLAEYMKGNLRRERDPRYSMFIDEEVEALLRRRYEDESPCPNWTLVSQWQRYGRILKGNEESWPGYESARREWDSESEAIWEQMESHRSD